MIFFLIGFAFSVQAQSTSEPAGLSGRTVSADGTKTTYEASFFSQYSPLSLNDMLQRIPGASISDSAAEGERRGLRGNEDAILINGQQITGKDSGGATHLSKPGPEYRNFAWLIQ
jgi:hypothetical protein